MTDGNSVLQKTGKQEKHKQKCLHTTSLGSHSPKSIPEKGQISGKAKAKNFLNSIWLQGQIKFIYIHCLVEDFFYNHVILQNFSINATT